MFKNYITTAWRNILREKVYTLINIAGLSVGIASCILIMLFVKDELSYDRFHQNSENIYRIYIEGQFGDNSIRSPFTSNIMAQTMEEELADVDLATRFYKVNRRSVQYEEKSFIEQRFFYGDQNFFKLFSFNLLRGDQKNILSKPHTIVITQSMAEKYFGNEDPIGKILLIEGDTPYQVTGVCEDVPANSHFHFDFVASISSTPTSKVTFWVQNNVFTYFKLKKGTDIDRFLSSLNEFVVKYVGPEVVQFMGIDLEEFLKSGSTYGFKIQPLQDIYLKSDLQDEIEPTGSLSTVYYFIFIALFILIIACINFMNLATAKYSNRAKEVGIRKVIGSRRIQLIYQFFIESIMLSGIALLIAIALVEIFLPVFNQVTQKDLNIHYLSSWWIIPAYLVFAITVGILSGSYPSFILSRFKPIKVLQGNLTLGFKSNRFRRMLVTVQFVITIVLFVSTIVIYRQLDFINHKDLGFSKEQVLVINRAYDFGSDYLAFKNELLKNPSIHQVSSSSSVPGKPFDGSTMQLENAPKEDLVPFSIYYVDYDFQKVLGLSMDQGRFFSRDFSSDSLGVIINQAAAKRLGNDNLLEKRLFTTRLDQGQVRTPILGIMKDFNYESLHKEIRPICLFLTPNTANTFLLVKIQSKNLKQTINFIDQTFHRFLPGKNFEYFFLDDDFEKLYYSERRTAKVFTIFSLLAIFVSALGLFGLTSFSVEKRNKEIGIRKAMGAGFINIVSIFYQEIFILLLVSSAIAWPLAYYLLNHWLDNFAYKIHLTIYPFVFATILAMVIAIFTVGSQIVKSAHTNPADVIRYE
ncbi:MAG: ABC transporter permease [Bacteroidales bacterium]|jgi:putative ABC transport system permease protein|nr:ABC transporter permease [Bacteroidales bacterium]